MEEIKKTKHWWAWNYYKAEEWLEKMESEGLRMTGVNGSGSKFRFVRDEPRKTRFCIDYQAKIDDKYIERVKNDGWEPFVINSNWCVCRKEYGGEPPEFEGDYVSLIKRNERFTILAVAGFMPILIAGPVLNGYFIITGTDPGYFAQPARYIYVAACIAFVMGLVSLTATGRMLKMKASRLMKRTGDA